MSSKQRPEEIVGTLEHELASYLQTLPDPAYPETGPGDFVMIVDHEATDRDEPDAEHGE